MTSPAQAGDGNLPAAREHLHNAIAALIDPVPALAGQPDCPDCHNQNCEPDCTEHRCPGHTTFTDSLYIQLYDAVPGEQGTGHGTARSLPALWLDAAKTLSEIDAATRKWVPWYEHCRQCQHCAQKPPTVARLEILRDRRWRPQDCAEIRSKTADLERWVIDIETLLTPQHVKHVAAACPACGHKTAQRRDSAGELVRVPALQIVTDTGCTCIVCKATWGPQLYLHLCRVLGFPLPAGVLE